MQTSLTKFSKDYNLPKSTVHRRCQELNLDTSDGLSPDDFETLLHEFNLKPIVETPEITVEVGNHQIVLATPELPQTYCLDSLRADESVQFEDPLAIATAYIQDADALQAAMQQDLRVRESKVNQTKQAKDAIAAKAAELKLEKRLYQERAHMLDTAQTSETAALQQSLLELQKLGKPQE